MTSPHIVHGKSSDIYHKQAGIFKDIPMPFQAGRYHSLILNNKTMSHDLEITAWTKDKIIMGIQHKDYPLYGVQFHPESILTEFGLTLIENFLTVN